MNKIQQNVREFHEKAGQLINDKPTIVDSKTAILRVRLLLEEVLEFAEASGVEILTKQGDNLDTEAMNGELTFSHTGKANLIEVADALADINYVSAGAAICYGIDMEPVDLNVHLSNLSKFIDGYRDENGKWIKGPSYTPVNLEPILKEQGWNS